jgi:transcription antitermination factor NusG
VPILGAEVSVFPDTLLEGLNGEARDRRWWVLYTKARQEKAVARRLLGFEIPFFLPLVPKSSISRGRKVTSHIPLFAGYVFLFGSDEERVRSLTTNRISRVLDVHDEERFEHDLRQVERLIAAKVPLTVESRLAPGHRVRVRFGPLAGLEGTVVTRRGEARLLVSVDFLQQGASVEIDDFMLEPLDSVSTQDRLARVHPK